MKTKKLPKSPNTAKTGKAKPPKHSHAIPCTKGERLWMKSRQIEHRKRGMSHAERWMDEKLLNETSYKWTFQAIWGWRLFDFWNAELGVAVEVDGPEHDVEYDKQRDAYNLERSAIIVYRVRNFNEDDAIVVIAAIKKAESWLSRRGSAGLLTKHQKRKLAQMPNQDNGACITTLNHGS